MRSDALGDFLAVKGLSNEWLIEQCEELRTNPEAVGTVLEILSDLVKKGIALPPAGADLVSAVLLDLAMGKDARDLVGTAPTRGRPVSTDAQDRRLQAGACLALMKLAKIPRSNSVRLLAEILPMAEREVEEILVPEMTGEWNHLGYLVELGGGTLEKLLKPRSDKNADEWRAKFIDFCSVTLSG